MTDPVLPIISIALATYNGEKYIKEQIDSIYSQTYKNIEVIVTDDCSNDGTIKILEQYAKSLGLKYYVNEDNLGFVKNFEKAISLCTGDLIALCDQDDVWRSDKLEKLYENIGNNLLIHSDAKLIDEKGNILSDSYARSAHKKFRCHTYEYFFNNDVTGCTTLFKRELLTSALPFPKDIIAHDWWLAICASKDGTITYINEPLIFYRQHISNQIGAENIFRIYSHIVREKAYRKTHSFVQFLFELQGWNNKEKKVLQDLISYYASYFNDTIRLKSFIIHLKYFHIFYNHKSVGYRLIGLFLSLFGKNMQEKFWRLINK